MSQSILNMLQRIETFQEPRAPVDIFRLEPPDEEMKEAEPAAGHTQARNKVRTRKPKAKPGR